MRRRRFHGQFVESNSIYAGPRASERVAHAAVDRRQVALLRPRQAASQVPLHLPGAAPEILQAAELGVHHVVQSVAPAPRRHCGELLAAPLLEHRRGISDGTVGPAESAGPADRVDTAAWHGRDRDGHPWSARRRVAALVAVQAARTESRTPAAERRRRR